MKITLDNGTAEYRITAYEPGMIRINDEVVSSPVIISPQKTERWDIENMAELKAAHLEYLAGYEPEILILGTGPTQLFPQGNILAPLISVRIGVEVMDTAAACRTYNVLMSEDRHVVAALFMI